MTNHTCEDQFGVIFAPLVEQEVGYRPGNPGIPMLDLSLALPMGLSAGKAVQQKVGSRVELKAFENGLFDDRAVARFSDMTNQK
jgi:hypothetical protein